MAWRLSRLLAHGPDIRAAAFWQSGTEIAALLQALRHARRHRQSEWLGSKYWLDSWFESGFAHHASLWLIGFACRRCGAELCSNRPPLSAASKEVRPHSICKEAGVGVWQMAGDTKRIRTKIVRRTSAALAAKYTK